LLIIHAVKVRGGAEMGIASMGFLAEKIYDRYVE
jgi:hypothetical protein